MYLKHREETSTFLVDEISVKKLDFKLEGMVKCIGLCLRDWRDHSFPSPASSLIIGGITSRATLPTSL